MKFLISKGSNVNEVKIPNKDQTTALHLACLEGNKEAVELLIQSGANVNMRDSEGFTPLFLAIKLENLEIIKLLVQAKADWKISSYYGDNLFSLLEEVKNPEIQEYFKKVGIL
jgi:ankyrin repeat protein